jgi:hypothetical protein
VWREEVLMIESRDIFLLPKDLKPYGTLLLLYLLSSDHDVVWASQDGLALALGCSKRTVIRTVAKLEPLGIISVRRFGSDGVNHYRVKQDVLATYLANLSTGNSSSKAVSPQASSSASSEPPQPSSNTTSVAPETCPGPSEITGVPSFQDSTGGSSDFSIGDVSDSGEYQVLDPVDKDNINSESFFSDPRLDSLVAQVEEGRKNGTKFFRWLQSQNLLTYYPPTDGYRVEKDLLRERVNSFDDLNAILNAPVRPEYQWFVAEFLQCCSDNRYEAEDTSQEYAFEINILLDSMLRAGYGGRAEWTAESIKAQLRIIVAEWARLKTWQARLTVEPPSVPTLEFLVMDKAIWQAAKERWSDENDAKLSALLDRFESGR